MKDLQTKRLVLRKITMNDLEEIHENWATDKITNEYLTFPCHKTKDQTKKMIDFILKKYEKDGYSWCIELKENHQVIGIINGETSYKYKCIEVGYSISSKYFNKGYVTEALQSIIHYFFVDCDFSIVEAIIPSKNKASRRVAEKCNMSKEAVLKNRYRNKMNNEINDLYIYSIFKEDYR